jgi:hypothetical protein
VGCGCFARVVSDSRDLWDRVGLGWAGRLPHTRGSAVAAGLRNGRMGGWEDGRMRFSRLGTSRTAVGGVDAGTAQHSTVGPGISVL